MLKLARRVGESVVVGDDIVVTVLAIDGNQIRIGVDAPKETAVHREEVYRRIQVREGPTVPIGKHGRIDAHFQR